MGLSDTSGIDRPWVRMSVAGVQTLALIDTGACRSLMSVALYTKLCRLPYSLEPTSVRLSSYTGHSVKAKGETIVPIGHGKGLRVIIVEGVEDTPLLIGADALRQAGSAIDFTTNTVTIGGQRYNMIPRLESPDLVGSVSEVPVVNNEVLKKIVEEHKEIFGSPGQLGECTLPPVTIETGDAKPIRQKAYRIPFSKRREVESQIAQMLEQGVITPSCSPWLSPIVLIPKKDNSTRFCVDYRKLNQVTIKDAYPLPNIRDIFDQLGGAKIFSTIDLKSGFWQIPVAPGDQDKLAFVTTCGSYSFKKLPMGLSTSPAKFQRIMDYVMSDLIGVCVFPYLDDLIIYSKNEQDHAKHLKMVFQRLKKYNLTLNGSKCHIGKSEVELLGFIISAQGIRPQPKKTEAIQNLAYPTTVREVKAFLGMAGYYRQCIPHFAHTAAPLVKLTRKHEPFIFGPSQRSAFNKLKAALTAPPILAYPDTSKPYILHTDASKYAIGAILSQVQDGQERVIAYLSHQLSPVQQRWSAIEREAYAVIYALDHLKVYLWGAEFVVYTDHKPLTSLFKAEIKNTKIQRWSTQISEFNTCILYRPGPRNLRADMLSRIASVVIKTEKMEKPPPEEYPLPWGKLKLDPASMAIDQQADFPDCWELGLANKEGYEVKHNFLYSNKLPYDGADSHLRLVLPAKYQYSAVELAHHECGHQGIAKTLEGVREYFVWPGLRRAVERYVCNCPLCALYYQGKTEKQIGRMPLPNRALATWGLDITGPFAPAVGTGNKYILTCIDHYTGWAEAVPIRDKSNKSVWEAFMSRIVAIYGLPEIIYSDRGPEFLARPFQKFLKECGIEHRKTTPYHPQTNGRTERFNGTLKRILAKLLKNDLADWENRLPEALWAYRTAHSVAVGMSPYKALFGVMPRQPQTKLPGSPESQRLRRLRHARKWALKHLEKGADARYRQRCQMTKAPPDLHVGDAVLLKMHSGPALQSLWEPGWMVEKVQGPVISISRDQDFRRVNREKLRLAPPNTEYIFLNPRERRRITDKWTIQPKGDLKVTLKKISGITEQSEWRELLRCVSSFCAGQLQQ